MRKICMQGDDEMVPGYQASSGEEKGEGWKEAATWQSALWQEEL